MNTDIQISNDIAIHIRGFETKYDLNADGERVEFDVVTYSPLGDDSRTRLTRRVDRLSKVLSLDDCGDNIAYLMAHKLWDRIEPEYDHWKQNNDMPMDGTPLGAWPGVTTAQATVMRDMGLTTVEAVADASDIVMGKSGISNAIKLRDMAKSFLSGEDEAKSSAEMATLKSENAELKDQMAELMAMVDDLTTDKKSTKASPRKAKAA